MFKFKIILYNVVYKYFLYVNWKVVFMNWCEECLLFFLIGGIGVDCVVWEIF